jgi:hypothetical protein
MKRAASIIPTAVLIIASLLITTNLLGASQAQTSPSVGRFQLSQGTFTTLDAKNNRADKETAVFLLDTSTGRVQRYSTGLDKEGKFYEGWFDTSGAPMIKR